MSANRQFLLCRHPQGEPVSSDFVLVGTAIPSPETGSFVVRNHFVSLDPAQRGYMDDVPSYMPPMPLCAAVTATTVGRVHASANPEFVDGETLAAEISAAAPKGVGGNVLDAALMNLGMRAGVLLCGLISEYNTPDSKGGAANIWQLIVKRATMTGFLIADYAPRFSEGGAWVSARIGKGRIRIDEDIVEGIKNAYAAFMQLLSGANSGKLILRLA